MKIAFLNTWRGGAVYNITKPIVDELNKRDDVEAEIILMREVNLMPAFDRTFGEYDLVHFSYFDNIGYFIQDIEVPFTCGVHHLPHKSLEWNAGRLNSWSPRHIVVSESFSARQLGQLGIYNTSIIPYVIDWRRYPIMPLPQEFTAGYLGCDYNLKRFKTIEQACDIANVKCEGIGRETLNEEEGYLDDDVISNLYKDMSCYVVASFDDGGPLPPQEALLCGRPVVSTRVGMMPQILKEGNIGVFHNGSASDMARAIIVVQHRLDEMCYRIKNLREAGMLLPCAKDAAEDWLEMFEEVLDNEQ